MAERDLERDIFGGSDSELSSDAESDRKSHISEDEAGYTEDKHKERYEGQMEQAGRRKSKKDEKSRTKKKRKRRSSKEPEEPPMELDPEEQVKDQVSRAVDAMIKPSRARPKKRKKQDEEILDRFADEEVVRLRNRMGQAADNDSNSIRSGQPATAKLKMLPEVLDTLQKISLQQSIFDNNLLIGVRQWLEPLPDKSLPALNIQNAFFELLPKLDIDTPTLKESGLGRIVLFYTRCKRVTPPIKRSAEHLVDVWSRPIIKRSASYKDREIQIAGEMSQLKIPKLDAIMNKAREDDASRVRKNAVRIPEADLATYSVAPMSGIPTAGPGAVAAQAETERKRMAAERLRKMQRKLAIHKQRSARL